MAIIVWCALIFKIKWLVVLSFVILALSAILTIKHAPMIVLWRYTLGRIFNSKTEILNVKAMRFAHGAGTILSAICVYLLYFGNEYAGWILVGFFAILKTISAFGFCPASKLYVCMSNGGCCAFSRKFNNINKRQIK